MKIKFTVFNGGQQHMEFDMDSLPEGYVLDKFLVSKGEDGVISILPMLHKPPGFWTPGDFLEPI